MSWWESFNGPFHQENKFPPVNYSIIISLRIDGDVITPLITSIVLLVFFSDCNGTYTSLSQSQSTHTTLSLLAVVLSPAS
jgi:hypothetical protein